MAGLGLGILLGCLKKITLFSLEVLYYFAAPFYAKSNEILEKQNMLGGKKKNPTNEAFALLYQSHSEMQRCQKSSKESLFKWEFSSKDLRMHLDKDLNHSGFLWSKTTCWAILIPKSPSHDLECLSVLEVVKQQN